MRQKTSTPELTRVFVDAPDHLVLGRSSSAAKEGRGGVESPVRSAGFAEFACEALRLLPQVLSGRNLLDLEPLGVAPHMQGLLPNTELSGHSPDRVRARPSLSGLTFQNHPHGTLPQPRLNSLGTFQFGSGRKGTKPIALHSGR